MRMGDLTPDWQDSPIFHEMKLKVCQHAFDVTKDRNPDAIGIGYINVPQDMFDELIKVLPTTERYVYAKEGFDNLMFMGWVLKPY